MSLKLSRPPISSVTEVPVRDARTDTQKITATDHSPRPIETVPALARKRSSLPSRCPPAWSGRASFCARPRAGGGLALIHCRSSLRADRAISPTCRSGLGTVA
jgi:hypothetical protein